MVNLDEVLSEIELALADNDILYINGEIGEEDYRYNKERIQKKEALVLSQSNAEESNEKTTNKSYWDLSFDELMKAYNESPTIKTKAHCHCESAAPEEYTAEEIELVELNETLNSQYTR